jgi:hypothetical protein
MAHPYRTGNAPDQGICQHRERGRLRFNQPNRLPELDNEELRGRVVPPDQFPGLIHRMGDPKTVILLFASGKPVCTGAKRESEVYRAVNNRHVLLEEKNLMVY